MWPCSDINIFTDHRRQTLTGFSLSFPAMAESPNDATLLTLCSFFPPTLMTSFQHHKSSDRLSSPQAGSHIQTLMGSQSLQHRSREQQPYEGNVNKVTIQQFQSPLPIQIPSSQATRGPQPGRCLIQTKGQRSMDGYPEQVRGLLITDEFLGNVWVSPSSPWFAFPH